LEYRKLGDTGEKVSTIGMGTWRIGSYGTPDERAHQVKALTRGIELGINLIDTAEVYASGRSEEVVRDAVRGARDDVFIATKVSQDHLRHDEVIRACDGSLARLGTSYIDLYQVHWPNPGVPIRETMKAMEELVNSGKVRYIGVSNFSVDQTQEAREALSRSELASNQVEYSLSNRGVEADVLPYCIKEKLSLIAYSPLARGRIAENIPQSLLRKYSMSRAQIMLNWVTRDEHVLAIPKAVAFDHMEQNAASVSVRFEGPEYDRISKG
jgi:diketogulonate reductase-like aldo/keto reductase